LHVHPGKSREVVIEAVGEDAYAAGLRQSGAPEWAIEGAIGSFRSLANGTLATVSDDVERLTGRRPMTVAEVLETAEKGGAKRPR
jgi:hypothetical protein